MPPHDNNPRLRSILLFTIALFAILAVAVLLSTPGADADGTTLYVDDDAPDGGNGSMNKPFNMIQDAVNASSDGDTVRVFNGTYYENVVVNKELTIVGNGSEVTSIDGGGKGDVVRIVAEDDDIALYSADTKRGAYASATNFKTDTGGKIVFGSGAVAYLADWSRGTDGVYSDLDNY